MVDSPTKGEVAEELAARRKGRKPTVQGPMALAAQSLADRHKGTLTEPSRLDRELGSNSPEGDEDYDKSG